MSSDQVTVFMPEGATNNSATSDNKQTDGRSKWRVMITSMCVLALLISLGHITYQCLINTKGSEEQLAEELTQPVAAAMVHNNSFNRDPVPFEIYQFHMDQYRSLEEQKLVWELEEGNADYIRATSEGCVRTLLGGKFYGTATIVFNIKEEVKNRYFTISANLKREGMTDVFINKVSEPIPTMPNLNKPVILQFFKDNVQANDELCIDVSWGQVKVSYIDNFWILMRKSQTEHISGS